MTRFKCYLEMTEWYDSNVTQWFLIFKRLEQQQWTPILQPWRPKVGIWLQETSKNHLKRSLSDWKMSMELSFHNWSHKMFIYSSFLVLRSTLNCSHCSFNLVVASACFDMKEVKLVGVRATSSGSSWKVKPRYEKTTLQIDNTSWTAQHMPVLELHDVFILGDPLLQLQDGGLEILFVFLVLTFPQHLQSTLEQPFIGALRICHKFFFPKILVSVKHWHHLLLSLKVHCFPKLTCPRTCCWKLCWGCSTDFSSNQFHLSVASDHLCCFFLFLLLFSCFRRRAHLHPPTVVLHLWR